MDTCSKCKKPTAVFPVTKRGFASTMCQSCYDWQKEWNSRKFKQTKERREAVSDGMKFCMVCRSPKPIGEFALSPYQHLKIASGVTEAKACSACRKIRAAERTAKRHEAHKDPAVKIPYLLKKRDYQRKFRALIVEAYGGHCVCCGETEMKFLQMDHVNNDGHDHRKQIGTTSGSLYRWALKNGFPPTLQVLCGSCHNAKSFYGGCPHQEFSVLHLVEAAAG
jgi:hypothetical protein